MGITTHNPEYLDFPATMTNMRSGICFLFYLLLEYLHLVIDKKFE